LRAEAKTDDKAEIAALEHHLISSIRTKDLMSTPRGQERLLQKQEVSLWQFIYICQS
jgi:hypothetical protein